MTPAEEVITLPGWRWMPGMLVTSAGTRYRMTEETLADGLCAEWARAWMRPHLDDAATVGCLLALVEEWVGAPVSVAPAVWSGGSVTLWEVLAHRGPGRVSGVAAGIGPDRAAALVAALAVPRRAEVTQ